MIFQDPISSLNPRRRVTDIVSEGLEIWSDGDIGTGGRERVEEVLHAVGIDPAVAASHRPHQFSGGQCQRISIARALTMNPEILICDEPVSALDVSVQAKILNLLEDMKARYDLSLVFISHDLSVVRNVSDRVVVMYLGKLCEVGGADRLYEAPAHPYTRALLASAPEPARSVGVAARTTSWPATFRSPEHLTAQVQDGCSTQDLQKLVLVGPVVLPAAGLFVPGMGLGHH